MSEPKMSDSNEPGDAGERRTSEDPAWKNTAKATDRAKAVRESQEPCVSEPGGFANDPNDPANPNEVIERHRRKLRPNQTGS